MTQFYVPVEIAPRPARGLPIAPIPASRPRDGAPSTEHPFFTTERQAASYVRNVLLKTHDDNRDVYHEHFDGNKCVTYGRDHTLLRAPKITAIYHVEVDDTALEMLKQNERGYSFVAKVGGQEYPFIGKVGYADLSCAHILDAVVTAHPDALHDTACTVELKGSTFDEIELDCPSEPINVWTCDKIFGRANAIDEFAFRLNTFTDEEREMVDPKDERIREIFAYFEPDSPKYGTNISQQYHALWKDVLGYDPSLTVHAFEYASRIDELLDAEQGYVDDEQDYDDDFDER